MSNIDGDLFNQFLSPMVLFSLQVLQGSVSTVRTKCTAPAKQCRLNTEAEKDAFIIKLGFFFCYFGFFSDIRGSQRGIAAERLYRVRARMRVRLFDDEREQRNLN